MAKKEEVRNRNWWVLLYPENPAHARAILMIKDYPKFAYITHDRDVWSSDDEDEDASHVAGSPKKVHVHVLLKFSNAKWHNALADELGIEKRFLKPCLNCTHALRYLVHADDPDKFQYDKEQVVTNMPVDLEKALQDVNEEDKVLAILDILNGVDGYISTQVFLRMICSAGLYADFRRSSYVFLKCLDEHNCGDAAYR